MEVNSVSVLQLCFIVAVAQLTLHAAIAPFVLPVLLHRVIAPVIRAAAYTLWDRRTLILMTTHK
jgi:hypothetical protein